MSTPAAILQLDARKSMHAYYDAMAFFTSLAAPVPQPANDRDRRYCSERDALRTFLTTCANGDLADLGCGAGLNIPFYVRGISSLLLVDQSAQMLTRAHRCAAHHRDDLQIISRQLDLLSWEQPPNSTIDTVLLSFVLSHLVDSEITSLLSGMNRLIRKSGQILIVDSLWHSECVTSAPDVLQPVSRTTPSGQRFVIPKRYFSPDHLSNLLSDYRLVSVRLGYYFSAIRLRCPQPISIGSAK